MKTALTSTVSLHKLHIDLLKLYILKCSNIHVYLDTTPNNYSFSLCNS